MATRGSRGAVDLYKLVLHAARVGVERLEAAADLIGDVVLEERVLRGAAGSGQGTCSHPSRAPEA